MISPQSQRIEFAPCMEPGNVVGKAPFLKDTQTWFEEVTRQRNHLSIESLF